MIAALDQTTIRATKHPLSQREFHPCTAIAAILRCPVRVDFLRRAASVCSFALMDYREASPGGILNGLCEVMVFNHPDNVQVFKNNVIEFLDKFETCLVVKVRALALYLLMFLCQQFDSFTSSVALFVRSACDSSLCRL